jgi:hypothetical protein
MVISGLTKKAEPPPTGDVNRDSGTDSANGGWLRRLVRPLAVFQSKHHKIKRRNDGSAFARRAKPARAKTNQLIRSLLIEMLLSAIIASQTSSVKIKNAEVA